MSIEHFEQTLRSLLRQIPFQPFVIRKTSGEEILVDEPAIAFDAGGGGFIGPDGMVRFFECEDVAEIVIARRETAQ